jgi:hypothetical protein
MAAQRLSRAVQRYGRFECNDDFALNVILRGGFARSQAKHQQGGWDQAQRGFHLVLFSGCLTVA